ncbi:hypothetical protein HK100_004260 [Physocladia obscura]|uniref:Uncharacterized protein n=1 Tax=Physocladia obscura TaxID=109957 RepID=A0AAD5XD38_9FUNG|nr:hypothetical protein HK100_004260 [Physocladia obscura]
MESLKTFYGWDVSNAIGGGAGGAAAAGDAAADESNDEDLDSHFAAATIHHDTTQDPSLSLKRVARDINMAEQGERAECERILRTFETLFGLSRRVLKRFYLQIEEMTPRIGQGLATMTNKQEEQEDQDDEVHKEQVWKHERTPSGTAIAKQNLVRLDDNEGDGDEDYTGSFDGVNTLRKREDDLVIRRNDALSISGEGSAGTNRDIDSNGNCTTNKILNGKNRISTATAVAVEFWPTQTGGVRPQSHGPLPDEGFNHSLANTAASQVRRGLLQDGPLDSDMKLSKIKDINLCYTVVNKSLDYLLVCISNVLLVMSFAELLDMANVFQKFNTLAHELSNEFVSNSLKTIWDLMNRELQNNVTLQELRDPRGQLRVRMKQIIELGVPKQSITLSSPPKTPPPRNPRHRFKTIHRKLELLHDLFTCFDIHLFPNFVAAHLDGIKSCTFSAFDMNLWLSGGYDGIIRIHDLRASNSHICLGQYVGHKSIVTDVHFTHDDSHIVSCSFDRTVKIWNSQSASCERTLLGHTDSVMSCDVSVDKRYIISGSTDNTARLWDFATGKCVAVIKKHTRWVKVTRFSPDTRFVATAGLDHKVYVWDVKFVANSRAFTPKRTIDDHRDYILDIALARPYYLLTTCRDNTVRMFDHNVGVELYSVSLSPSWACTISFSASGEYFATGSFDNNVIIFSSRNGNRVRQIRVLNLGIMCVRWPKDLSCVVVGTQEGFIQQIPL